ncbi:MAG: leucine-rich repeat protein [Lachnospiraceae bacterium]
MKKKRYIAIVLTMVMLVLSTSESMITFAETNETTGEIESVDESDSVTAKEYEKMLEQKKEEEEKKEEQKVADVLQESSADGIKTIAEISDYFIYRGEGFVEDSEITEKSKKFGNIEKYYDSVEKVIEYLSKKFISQKTSIEFGYQSKEIDYKKELESIIGASCEEIQEDRYPQEISCYLQGEYDKQSGAYKYHVILETQYQLESVAEENALDQKSQDDSVTEESNQMKSLMTLSEEEPINESSEKDTSDETDTTEEPEEVTWKFDSESSTLTISGSGTMENYENASSVPWYDDRENVKNVVIADTVTGIGDYSFSGCSNLVSADIPDSVISLGKNAFYGCTSLASVQLPDSIESIGFQAFASCTSLGEINIPLNWKECPSTDGSTSDIEHRGRIFIGCESLVEITVPEGMTVIPSYGFNGSDYLETINLPNTLTEIKNHAFFGCKKIKIMEIPESVAGVIGKSAFCQCTSIEQMELSEGITELQSFAFDGCVALKKVVLPDSIEKIGYKAFIGCKSLTDINIPLSWNECPSWDGSTIDTDHCGLIFQGCEALVEITIPEGMTAIPSFGFNGSDYLETVNLPDTLTEIKNHTFFNCKKLKNIEIPESVEGVIGKSAFCYCSSLEGIVLPSGIAELQLYAFNECTALEKVILPDSIKKIGYRTFYGCKVLSDINIPLNWNECPSWEESTIDTDHCGQIFKGCTALTEITIPEGMTAIPSFGFNGSDYLETVNLPDTLTEIKNHTFFGCKKLKNVEIPKNVTGVIGKSAFNQCASIEQIELPEGITGLQGYAFYYCTSLNNIILSEELKSVGDYAFYYCTGLKTIDLKNIEQLGEYTFSKSGLTSITIENITNLGFRSFENCKSLDEIFFNATSYQLTYNTGGYSTFTGCGSGVGKMKVTIGPEATYISALFTGCSNLTDIVMPDNVTKIGVYAFYNCKNLKDVTMPKQLTAIGTKAFYNCSALDKIEINSDITVSSDAFTGAQMNELALGENVMSLESAFYQKIPIGNFEVNEGNTSYTSDKGVLYDKGKQILLCFPNKSDITKCSIPESVTQITDYAFYNNSVLEEVEFLEDAETDVVTMEVSEGLNIGKYAFSGCNSIAQVTMPASLNSMGDYALADCSSLEAVHFKGNAPQMSSNVFQNDYTALGYRDGTDGWTEETFKSDMAKKGIVIINEDEKYDRVCVLLLDHSWSMDGDPLKNMKEAATAFCNNILNKMKYKTALCIVPFCGTSKAFGFSSDKNDIKSYINNIECDNSTNIYDAALSANRFLKMVNADEKNIMLMTDGIPITGSVSNDGPYTSSDIATYYKYANAVYNLVKSFSAGYRIFTVGFFSELSESEQKFAKKFLEDLSTHGYYDATEIEDITTKFEEIAAGINGDTYLNMKEDECAFYFYDAETGESLSNVSFMYGLERYESDKEGFAKISVSLFERTAKTLSFTKTGYNTEKESIVLKQGEVYPIGLTKEAEVPTVYRCDLQYEGDTSYIDIVKNEVSLYYDDKDVFSLTVTAGYKGGEIKSYAIKQAGKILKSNNTGCFEKLTASDFKSGDNNIVIEVEGEKGDKYSYSTKLSVYGESEEVQEKIDLGKGLSCTVPINFPIVGGVKIDLDYLVDLPIQFSVEGKKVKIVVNVGTVSTNEKNNSKGIFDKDSWNMLKTLAENKKDISRFSSWLNTNSYGWNARYMKQMQAKVGPGSLKMDVYGYLEGELSDSGQLKDIENIKGAIVIKCTAKAETENQILLSPPIIIKVGIKGGVEGDWGVSMSKISTLGDLKLTGKVTLSVSVSAGVGIGYAKIMSLTGNGEGTLSYSRQFDQGYNKAELKGKLYLTANILGFTTDVSPQFLQGGPWTIYEEYDNEVKQSKNVETKGNNVNPLNIIMDENEYEVAERTYLETQSEWNKGVAVNKEMASLSVDDKESGMTILQSSVYDDPQMRLVQTDDVTMMVFLSDDADRDAVDRTKLVYSIYDEESDTWSTPEAVWDDGTGDYMPEIETDGSNIWIAWMNANRKFGDDAEFTNLLPAMEIAIARFDGNGFTECKNITNNTSYDCMPSLVIKNGAGYISWIQNTSNNALCNDSTNNVFAYSLEDENTTELASGISNIKDFEAGILSESNVVTYITDGDGNYTTTDDTSMYVMNFSGKKLFSYEGKNNLSQPYYYNGNLIWSEANGLKCLKNVSATEENFLGFSGYVNSEYQILENENYIYILLLNNADQENSNDTVNVESFVYTYDKTAEVWNKATQLTDLNTGVQSTNGFFTSDGKIGQIITANEYVSDNTANVMSIYSTVSELYSDYELADLYYDDAIITDEGYELDVDATIQNIGQLKGGSYKVELVQGENVLASQTFDDGIMAGESVEQTIRFSFSDAISHNSEYKVVVSVEDDPDQSNNTQLISLGKMDVAVNYSLLEYGEKQDKYRLAVSVTNQGIITTDAILKLYCMSTENEAFQTIDIPSLRAGQTRMYIVDLDIDEADYVNNKYRVYMVAETSLDDSNILNNTDYVLMMKNVEKEPEENIEVPEKDTPVKVSKITLSGISKQIAAGRKIKLTASVLPSNATNKAVTWKSSNTKVATVTQSGVVTMKKGSGGKSVTITATAKDGSGVKATYKIKSMKGVVKKVSISGSKSVKAGKSLKLKAKVTATKSANKKLKWTSSNTKYAKVSNSGKVTTYKAGKGKKVKITAMATDGSGKKKTVTIKIT